MSRFDAARYFPPLPEGALDIWDSTAVDMRYNVPEATSIVVDSSLEANLPQIAHEYLGDSSLWWTLLYFNGITDPIGDIYSMSVLRIPRRPELITYLERAIPKVIKKKPLIRPKTVAVGEYATWFSFVDGSGNDIPAGSTIWGFIVSVSLALNVSNVDRSGSPNSFPIEGCVSFPSGGDLSALLTPDTYIISTVPELTIDVGTVPPGGSAKFPLNGGYENASQFYFDLFSSITPSLILAVNMPDGSFSCTNGHTSFGLPTPNPITATGGFAP